MGLQPVIYADTLVFMNTVITFLLLLTCQRISGNKPPPGRMLTASCVGGLYSLILLAPSMPLGLMLLTKAAMSVSLVALAFHLTDIKRFLRCLLIFCAVSFLYAGILYALSSTLSGYGFRVNNGYAYYNFSVFAILGLCGAITLGVRLCCRYFSKRRDQNRVCRLTLRLGEKKIETTALMDSGCELTDAYTDSPVIVLSREQAVMLTGNDCFFEPEEKSFLLHHMRLIPVTCVSGQDYLPAFTADEATVITEEQQKTVKNPSVAVCKENLLNAKYRAILNPDEMV